MTKGLYKGEKSNILSALTFNDATFWGADVFVGVIFALYVTQYIPGGSAIHVGLIYGLYRLMRALTSIPIGRYLDKQVGHIDEYYTLLTAGLIVGITYICLFFSAELWHVYLGMAIIGTAHALDINAWRILFYGNISPDNRGSVIGVYETTMQIMYALSIVIAGFVGEIYGFNWILLFAGIVTLCSSLILFLVRDSSSQM